MFVPSDMSCLELGSFKMAAVWRREMALGVCQPTHSQHGLTSMTSVEMCLKDQLAG